MKNKRLFNVGTKYTPKLLGVLQKFGMGPALDLSGLEKDILDVISQIEDAGVYDLCECFDMKPSKMEKYLTDLEDQGLVEYMDAAGKVYLTDLACRYLEVSGKDTKSQRKFRKFIECLSEEELDEFVKLADSFEIDETLLPAEEETAEAPDEEILPDNFTIVDEEAAEAEAPADAEEEPAAEETAAPEEAPAAEEEAPAGIRIPDGEDVADAEGAE
jgi:DNA-binding MarR family transcriptional regulator